MATPFENLFTLLDQTTTPSNPISGTNALYFKSDDKPYTLNSAGSEIQLMLSTSNLPALQVASSSNQDGVVPTANGSGGLYFASNFLRVGADNNTFLYGTGTQAELCLANHVRLYYATANGGTFAIGTGDFTGAYFSVNMSSGDASFSKGAYWGYYSLQPGGSAYNSTPLNITAGSNTTLWSFAQDSTACLTQIRVVANGCSADALDYWAFDRTFTFIPTGIGGGGTTHTGWTELNSGTGVANTPDITSTNLVGSVLTGTSSGLTMTISLLNNSNNFTPKTARITAVIYQLNGHSQ